MHTDASSYSTRYCTITAAGFVNWHRVRSRCICTCSRVHLYVPTLRRILVRLRLLLRLSLRLLHMRARHLNLGMICSWRIGKREAKENNLTENTTLMKLYFSIFQCKHIDKSAVAESTPVIFSQCVYVNFSFGFNCAWTPAYFSNVPQTPRRLTADTSSSSGTSLVVSTWGCDLVRWWQLNGYWSSISRCCFGHDWVRSCVCVRRLSPRSRTMVLHHAV